MRKYIILNNHFSIKGDQEMIYLFNISNGKRYSLNEEQINILKKMDGSYVKSRILIESNTGVDLTNEFINNLEKLGATDYLERKVRRPRKDIFNLTEKPRLKDVHWEITSKCNLHCLHCYQSSYLYNTKELTLRQIKNVIEELVKLGAEKVSISGGEPLLRKNLFEILTCLEDNNIRVSAIFTNGTLISKDFLQKLKLMKSNTNLNISLDGITLGSMAIRGFKQSNSQKLFLNKVVSNIKMAKSLGFSIRINTILNKSNIDCIEAMYEFLSNEVKGVLWSIGFPRELGSCVHNKTELMIEFNCVFDICKNLIKKHLYRLRTNNAEIDLKIQYLFHKKFLNNLNFYTTESFLCNYDDKNSMCCLKPNGDVLPCPVLLNFKVGNVLKEKLSSIWKSKEMRRIKEMKLNSLVKCANCKHLSLCGGGCRASAYSNLKNISLEDPLACKALNFFKSDIMPLLENYDKQ